MDELKIPEDLQGEYEAAKWRVQDHGSPGGQHKMALIERIARLEAERDELLVAAKEALKEICLKESPIKLKRGPCIAFDSDGKEVAWIVDGDPSLVITTILGM